jgi:hypothetical protein
LWKVELNKKYDIFMMYSFIYRNYSNRKRSGGNESDFILA